jgi:DNA-binding response OmpR family regulator
MAADGELREDVARGRAATGDDPAGAPDPARRRRRLPACPAVEIGFRLEDAAAARNAATRATTADPDARRPAQTLPVASDLDVELDLLARELRRAGRPVHVRPKEFLLLAILAANPGRAFSRRQLLDLAWDPQRGIDTRTVDVHVHWLRAKIEAFPRRPTHLVTVRGYGYRLDPWPPGPR